MSETASNNSAPQPSPLALKGAPGVRQVAQDAPWNWLRLGWADLMRMPALSLSYGLVFFGVSLLIILSLTLFDAASMSLVMASGFMLVGPMMAVGIYELSRRLEKGEPVSLRDILLVKVPNPLQLAYMGMLLMLMLLAWIRMATLVFALVWGTSSFPPLSDFFSDLLFTFQGLTLLAVGSAIGGVIAFAVFAVSVVSVPLLMSRRTDVMTAVFVSLDCVNRNFRPMLLWAAIIAAAMAVGLATLLLGMIVIFPLIGHATWHAFREIVEREAT